MAGGDHGRLRVPGDVRLVEAVVAQVCADPAPRGRMTLPAHARRAVRKPRCLVVIEPRVIRAVARQRLGAQLMLRIDHAARDGVIIAVVVVVVVFVILINLVRS